MSRTIYFLFSYYLDKNRYNFPAGQKKKILRQNIKKENKCNLWLLTLFLPLNTEEISSSL